MNGIVTREIIKGITWLQQSNTEKIQYYKFKLMQNWEIVVAFLFWFSLSNLNLSEMPLQYLLSSFPADLEKDVHSFLSDLAYSRSQVVVRNGVMAIVS